MMDIVLGIDFDNTLVSYDEPMYAVARERGLIAEDVLKSKKEIRDTIRQLDQGENQWQKLQAFVYGDGMKDAHLMEGVQAFLLRCKAEGIAVFIVSHKTQFASMDIDRAVDLRQTALQWMENNKFFEKEGLDLKLENVFFEPTRQKKIERIISLGCTHFIDDLEETFAEGTFPHNIVKILFSSQSVGSKSNGMNVFQSWSKISGSIFNN